MKLIYAVSFLCLLCSYNYFNNCFESFVFLSQTFCDIWDLRVGESPDKFNIPMPLTSETEIGSDLIKEKIFISQTFQRAVSKYSNTVDLVIYNKFLFFFFISRSRTSSSKKSFLSKNGIFIIED